MQFETWPSEDEFLELAKNRRVVPVVRKIMADEFSAIGLYRGLGCGGPGTFLLESAEFDGSWNRWSFIGVRSRAILSAIDGQARWHGEVPEGIPTTGPLLATLRQALSVLKTEKIPGLPPLTGAFVGSLGWNTLTEWEPAGKAETPSEFPIPDATLALVGEVCAVDHYDGSVWLVSNAINFNGEQSGAKDAYERSLQAIEQMQEQICEPLKPQNWQVGTEKGEIRQRVGEKAFEEMVVRAKEHIRAGNIFQVVLSQRIDMDTDADPLLVYRMLRQINPSPYMYLLNMPGPKGSFAVVGSSPETLMRLEEGILTTFPIAGSRPRGKTPAEDLQMEQSLLADAKERAEHTMLVDLSRNDLSKVCDPATLTVDDFMSIKKFSHIMHICSTVSAKLLPQMGALDAFTATFPAGTLSGAPKPRALQIISEFEPAQRNVFGGVVGRLDLDGDADLAIAIRTAVIFDGTASVQSGAGIVADSDPHTEYIETRNKAAAVLQAVRLAQGARSLDTDRA